MFILIQTIALIQGLFLLFLLFKKRDSYEKTPFILLFCCILSVISYILGDDDNNLFVEGADWFLFDTSLFITLLLLFSIYIKTGKEKFKNLYYLLLIPNLIYFGIEALETRIEENQIIELIEFCVELTFTIYLVLIFLLALKNQSKRWLAFFIIPIFFLFLIARINEIAGIFNYTEPFAIDSRYYDSGIHLTVAFLFYFMVYKLVVNKEEILPLLKVAKYTNSSLSKKQILDFQNQLKKAMEQEKLYLNRNLSIDIVAHNANISKQHISEVLNVHMNTNFQDFINSYRVKAFIHSVKNNEYKNYTILAVANEVGFNSKSTFNAVFKKFKGVTPTEFKKSLSM